MNRESQKRRNRFKALLCIVTLFLSGACASSYNSKAASAHHAYHRGDYVRALKLIDKVKPARRDKLLYLLDKGMILNAAGEYEESNKVLTEAEELSDALYAKSLTREVAATLWSEEARDYHGERYERTLIPVIRIINYIMLDEWDGALVEVRRLNNAVEKIYGTGYKFDNYFSLYLSAVVWEALGHLNDAHIDYKKMAKGGANVPYYGHDLRSSSSRLGMPVKLPPKNSAAWTKSRNYRKGNGELVVIATTGRSPHFVSEWVSTGYFSVSMPRAVAYAPRVERAEVIVDGKKLGTTHAFHEVSDDIAVALRERSKRSMTRKMVKLAVQTGLYTAGGVLMTSDETEQQIAGLALAMLAMSMAAADKADERSWRTLPATFQIGRFYLKPGEHRLEIVPDGGGTPLKRTITISGERPAVVMARFGDTSSLASHSSVASRERSPELRAEERNLLRKVRSNPDNGSLKLELARVRMARGKYDVERLLTKGMEQGSNRREATLLLVAALTVQKRYPEALRWVEKAGKSGVGGNRAYYKEALEYAIGKRTLPPSAKGPALTERKNMANAFNHFLAGLVDERSGDYDDATEAYAKAYELGLGGKPVMERIVESYKRTDEIFKESERGVKIVSNFANAFVGSL